MEEEKKFTIGKLISVLAVEKDITGVKIAQRLNINRGTVSRFLSQQNAQGSTSQNQWIERIDSYMDSINVQYQFLDAKKKVFEIPSTITTLGQLFRKLGKVYVKLSDGREFRIIQNEEAGI